MSELNLFKLPLKSNWMERPYFGNDLSDILEGDQDEKGSSLSESMKNWTEEGMQCCALKSFLNNKTGGIFLVAGTRGIGKTSLVRHLLHQWRKEGAEGIKRKLEELEKQGRAADKQRKEKLLQEKERYTFQTVDAADLGLFETVDPKQLERVLVLGLLRTLQEAMIPLEKRATLWSAVTPDKNDTFYRDLVTLVLIASSYKAQKEINVLDKDDSHVKGGAGIGLKLPYFHIGGDAEKGRQWSEARNSQLSWSNSTDALHAELRALFKRHRDRAWPLLVLDEWDRFEEGDSVDVSSGKKEKESADTNNENGTAGQKEKTEKSRQQERKAGPTVSDVLKALGRIKGLLADYPAPVIVISGEGIYKKVRRHKRNLADTLWHEDVYSTIFSQQCFLSPMPFWLGNESDAVNPLLPYLRKITAQAAREIDLQDLADYLLMEIGPNPHTLKLFLAHYSTCNSLLFTLSKTQDTIVKIVMGQAIMDELQTWEKEYAGIVPAGPYQRLCWFRYLRDRLLRYWKCPASYDGKTLCLPKANTGQIPNPLNLLIALEEGPLENTEDKNIHQQMMNIDLRLLNTFHKKLVDRYGLEKVEELIGKEGEKSWSGWVDAGLIPSSQGQQTMIEYYDISMLLEFEQYRKDAPPG
ncbi:MAG: ATP-binding protein [Gammaproteobacteria bacterium]|nr:ATP-binding protein [Gammaproteobacteria bacterium]